MFEETKKCPYCGEQIDISAKKCRFCGEWLKKDSLGESGTKKCPYCGEEILSVAKKCKFCGEWLEKDFYLYNSSNFDNPTLYKIAKMQNVSNILWKVISIIMIIFGLLTIAFSSNTDFQQGIELNETFCITQGLAWLILGIYNLCNIPSELPKKILKSDYYVVDYYKDIAGYILALIINLVVCFLGAFLVGFDLYIRYKVMKNVNLFKKYK